MAAHSVVRSLTDEYLTCRICLQAFDRPRRISCQHSFCKDCIRQLVTKSPVSRGPDKLLCPLCRSEVLIPADVSLDDFVCNLQIDSLIVDLQNTLSRHNRNPEISRTANVNSNDSCKAHPGRQLGHYCFHHAQLICGKCIDDFHHEPHCRCRSLIEARRELQPRVDCVLQRLHSELNEAELEAAKDRSFENSKQKTLDDITSLEQRLEKIIESCRRQISVLRSDVERLNREYILNRKDFFTVVHSLLESTSHLESLNQGNDNKHLIELLPSVEGQLNNSIQRLCDLKTNDKAASLAFTLYDEVSEFIRRFSAVGFIELQGVPSDLSADLSHLQLITTNSDAPPLSLSHILNRRN